MINFIEERLELGIDYGSVGGVSFKTSIIDEGNTEQQRNINWWLPLGRWQLGDRTLLESDIEQIQEVQYLKSFHESRQGKVEGFRFKDWSDYEITNQVIGVGDGNRTEWQLVKTYDIGDISFTRPITKPVEGTVRLLVGYLERFTGWTIDHSSGKITFDQPPPISAEIRVFCEFDIPVWFESDTIGWRLEGYQDGEAVYRLENVFVKEGRISLSLPFEIKQLPQNLHSTGKVLDLGIIYDTTESIKYPSTEDNLVNGYFYNQSYASRFILKLNLGNIVLDSDQLRELLNFFWCAQGQARTLYINYKNQQYLCRFDRDDLSLKFEAYDKLTQDKLFLCSGLSFESYLGS